MNILSVFFKIYLLNNMKLLNEKYNYKMKKIKNKNKNTINIYKNDLYLYYDRFYISIYKLKKYLKTKDNYIKINDSTKYESDYIIKNLSDMEYYIYNTLETKHENILYPKMLFKQENDQKNCIIYNKDLYKNYYLYNMKTKKKIIKMIINIIIFFKENDIEQNYIDMNNLLIKNGKIYIKQFIEDKENSILYNYGKIIINLYTNYLIKNSDDNKYEMFKIPYEMRYLLTKYILNENFDYNLENLIELKNIIYNIL